MSVHHQVFQSWKGTELPHTMALMRILLGMLLFWDALFHWSSLQELYSDEGLVLPFFKSDAFIPPTLSGAMASAVGTVYLVLLGMVVLGCFTRVALISSAILMLWLGLLDGPGTMTKYTIISFHLLILLCFTDSHSIWSFDAIRLISNEARFSSVWPRRLMQILVCSIYAGAAVTKIRNPDYLTGDLLTFSLLDSRWGGTWLGHYLSTFPLLMVVISMGTLFFEIAFPFLIWNSRVRPHLLKLAFGIHLGMACLLQIGIFTPVMWVLLLCFVDVSRWNWLRKFSPGAVSKNMAKPSRSSVFSRHTTSAHLLGVICCALITMLIGRSFQKELPFNIEERIRHWNWKNVSEEDFLHRLSSTRLRWKDYVHSSGLGHRVASGHLFGESELFREGDKVFVLARVTQPHPELELRCTLINQKEEQFEFMETLEANSSHLMMTIQTTDQHQPGTYRLKIRARSVEANEEFEEFFEEQFTLQAAITKKALSSSE